MVIIYLWRKFCTFTLLLIWNLLDSLQYFTNESCNVWLAVLERRRLPCSKYSWSRSAVQLGLRHWEPSSFFCKKNSYFQFLFGLRSRIKYHNRNIHFWAIILPLPAMPSLLVFFYLFSFFVAVREYLVVESVLSLRQGLKAETGKPNKKQKAKSSTVT